MADWALETIYLSIYPFLVALRKASWLTGRWAVVYLSIRDRPEKNVMVDWALGSCLSVYPYVVALRKPSWLTGRWAVVCLFIHTWSP